MEGLVAAILGDKHGGARGPAALLLLLVLLASPALFHRARVEKSSPVAILVDSEEVEALARANGRPSEQLLAALRGAGVVGVGLHELTLEELAARPPFFAATKATLEAAGSPVAEHLGALPGRAFLFGWRGPIEPWLEESLREHLPLHGEPVEAPGWGGSLWLLDPQLPLDAVGIGFDREKAAAIRDAGLEVVLRPRDGRRAPGAVALLLSQIEREKPLAVIFWGSSILGHPEHLEELAGALQSAGSPLGLIEFTSQAGAGPLAKALGYRVLRVHSIAPHEFSPGFDQDAALDRWLRAVRERRATLLYARHPWAGDGGTSGRVAIDRPAGEAHLAFGAYLAYLEALSERLSAAGIDLGKPVPLEPPPLFWPGLAAAVVGVAAAAGFFAGQVWKRGALLGWVVAAGGIAAFWLLWLKGYTVLARQAASFGAALVFPALGVYLAARRVEGTEPATPEGREGAGGPARGLLVALSAFALATFVTLVGALFLVVLLGDVRFLVKVEEFRGVKAAHLFPPLLLAAIFVPRPADRPLREWLSAPVRLWQVLLGLAGAGLVAVYLLRTGNDGLPVPAVEDAFRRALEQAFVARPRTKEFLLGHPALLAGLAFRAQGSSKLAAPLLVAGSIGQVSILNTFAHAHTPLLLSVARTGYGLLFGLLLGAIGVFLWERALGAWRGRLYGVRRGG